MGNNSANNKTTSPPTEVNAADWPSIEAADVPPSETSSADWSSVEPPEVPPPEVVDDSPSPSKMALEEAEKQPNERKDNCVVRGKCDKCCDSPKRKDEAVPIAKYMADEMNTNAKSEDAKKIKELLSLKLKETYNKFMGDSTSFFKKIFMTNFYAKEAYKVVLSARTNAFLIWANNVRPKGVWDHKPDISKNFKPSYRHCYNNWEYYYDVWSNIHYGYVGTAAGMSEGMLLDGAGMEQIGSDILRGKMPEATGQHHGLRKFDHPADRITVSLGISLYKSSPNSITYIQLLSAVEGIREELHKYEPKLYKKHISPC